MNSLVRLVAMIAVLTLTLSTTPTWGGPPNPTPSDDNLNTAGGSLALESVVTNGDPQGAFNTAFGSGALRFTTTGVGNTAAGLDALSSNTTGNSNTAIGIDALVNNSTGSNNTASGDSALHQNTTGNNNTASGFLALSLNTTGAGNTAIGVKALRKSTGTKNIAIGYQAGVTLQTGSNNIFIGNQGAGNESQTIRIGTAQAQTFIAGIVTAGVSGATVEVDGNGQLGIQPSSARYKQDIVPMGARSEKVLELRPVTFAYRNDPGAVEHYGLIAEEVAAVYPHLVTYTPTGEVQAVRYQELVPMLLNELQRERQARQGQEQALQQLQRDLVELRTLMAQRPELAGAR